MSLSVEQQKKTHIVRRLWMHAKGREMEGRCAGGERVLHPALLGRDGVHVVKHEVVIAAALEQQHSRVQQRAPIERQLVSLLDDKDVVHAVLGTQVRGQPRQQHIQVRTAPSKRDDHRKRVLAGV